MSLARFIGASIVEANVVVVPSVAPGQADVPERTALVEQAKAQAHVLRELEAAAKGAQIGVQVARDGVKPQLDAKAWLTVEGLGNNDVPAAFEMFGTFAAVSGFVGMELALPLDNGAARAELARSLVASRIAEERVHDGSEQVVEAAMQALGHRSRTRTEPSAPGSSADRPSGCSRSLASANTR